MVKHKSKYSCESEIYFNLNLKTIKENCKFKFFYNHPTVLGGGNETILANWPNDKHIKSDINSDIPIKIPSQQYVLVYRSALCICGIEAENHILLKSLATYQDTNSNLTMYFTVNTAFVHYLDKFPNLTESLAFTFIRNKTTFEQTLLIFLNVYKFAPSSLTASSSLIEFINSYSNNKRNF